MKFLKLVLSFLLIISAIFPYTSTNAEGNLDMNFEEATEKMVEAVILDYYKTNDEGVHVVKGYRVMNVITEIEEKESILKYEVQDISDYYDLDGNFIKSELSVEKGYNNYETGEAESKTLTDEYSEPQTVIEGDDMRNESYNQPSEKKVLTIPDTVDKEAVITEKLEETVKGSNRNFKKEVVEGFTHNDIKLLEEELVDYKASLAKEKNEKQVTTNSVQASGAFDNYYNHDLSNGEFVAQSIAYEDQYYHRNSGNATIGGNGANLNSFMNEIDNYEYHTVQGMDRIAYSLEVASWASFISGVATMGGPAHWVAVGTISMLVSLTSAVYATASRYEHSINAAKALENAQNINWWSNWDNADFEAVRGF